MYKSDIGKKYVKSVYQLFFCSRHGQILKY